MSTGAYRRENRVERIRSQVLSVSEIADVALRLIRAEGVDAVTIRRLADELDVKSASLYYHFKNKDEILTLAARVAIQKIRGSGDPNRPWQDWLLDNAIKYREALLVYPDLVPTLLRRHPLHIGTSEHEKAVQLMEEQGCPTAVIMPLFDALEALVCGSVLYATAVDRDDRAQDWQEKFPAMYRVNQSAGIDTDEAFRLAAQGVIAGLSKPFLVLNVPPSRRATH